MKTIPPQMKNWISNANSWNQQYHRVIIGLTSVALIPPLLFLIGHIILGSWSVKAYLGQGIAAFCLLYYNYFALKRNGVKERERARRQGRIKMKTLPPQMKNWIKKSKTLKQLRWRLSVAILLPPTILFFTVLALSLVTNSNLILYPILAATSVLVISLYNSKALNDVIICDWKKGVRGLKKGFK